MDMGSIMVKQIKTSCARQRKETGGKKTMKKFGGKQVLAGALSAAMVLGSAMPALAATGWNQDTTGWWWENSDGSYVVNNWVQDAGKWYFMDGNGYMSRGWIWDNGTWYFADASGAMLTGWVRVDGSVYYLNPVSDGTQGAMVTGTRTIDGVEYTFDASGACMNSTSYNRDEIPSYYGNGSVAVANEAARGGSGGGSSSSGGSSSGQTDTTTAEELTQDVTNAAENVAESSEAVAAVETATEGTATTITVTLEENVNPETTVAQAVGDVIDTVVEAINNEDVTKVEYHDMVFEVADKENAIEMLRDRANSVHVVDLQESYSVTVTLANNETATYTIVLQ